MKKIKINTIKNNVLDNKHMAFVDKITCEEHKQYYVDLSGREHYRLLSYLSEQIFDTQILDIGTFKGCSALAFASNSTNKVFSFNTVDQLQVKDPPSNITFIVGDVMHLRYVSLIQESKIIMLDTMHDGSFEVQFLRHLMDNGFRGKLILDDIHLNPAMENFWADIQLPKIDITHIGHSTGTGIVTFN